MNRSGLTNRLIRFVNLIIGHYPGGLSHVNIGGSIIFAGMTGAAVTDTVAIGNILIPAMQQVGIHPLHFALILLVNLNIGMITPPCGMTLLTAARIADCS